MFVVVVFIDFKTSSCPRQLFRRMLIFVGHEGE